MGQPFAAAAAPGSAPASETAAADEPEDPRISHFTGDD
jgi:hypothetical protein